MAGPIFVVELEPGLWMNAGNYSTDSFEKAKHFPSEIQAQSRLDYYRRYHYWRNAKIVVKNEYHRLLNVAGQKGFNRGWVWHRLTEKFSEDQLRCLPRHPRGWWKQPASEQ